MSAKFSFYGLLDCLSRNIVADLLTRILLIVLENIGHTDTHARMHTRTDTHIHT